MPQVTGYAPAQQSSGITIAGQKEARGTIKDAIRDLHNSLTTCSQKTFRRFDKNGNQMPDDGVDLSEALKLLEDLESGVPRFMILPSNRRRAVELLSAINIAVERTCDAIDLLNQEGRAAEAGEELAGVFDELQKLIDEISAEVPDESKLRHIRDVAQAILLVIGVAAFVVLNVFSFGLPALVIGAISLTPLAVGFSWNRIYDWCTTPCPVWKPMRNLVTEIRHSVERSNMFATSVINRMEPQINNVRADVDALRTEVGDIRKDIDGLRTEFQNMAALMIQVLNLNRQGGAASTAAHTQDAANEASAALHIAQFG